MIASDQESRADAAYRHLLSYIEREDLPEGARLPSESEFVERLGLSRSSIRDGLSRLRAEGRAVSRRGSGTFTARNVPAEMVRLSAIDFRPGPDPVARGPGCAGKRGGRARRRAAHRGGSSPDARRPEHLDGQIA